MTSAAYSRAQGRSRTQPTETRARGQLPTRTRPRQNARVTRRLQLGDPVQVGGGYDNEPPWLASNPDGYRGRVAAFIPGQNEQPAAVIELDDELVLPEGTVEDRQVRGRFLVLELGHAGTDWSALTPRIHVELCDFAPEAKPWDERRQGVSVESHASYRIIE